MDRQSDRTRALLLVTGSRFTQKSLAKQLSGFLPEDVAIVPYMVEEKNPPLDGTYFTVFSSEEVYEQFLHQGGQSLISSHIVGTRTVINSNIDQILTLPRDQKILLVTDSEISAVDSISNLQRIGFDFLQLIPFYPGCDVPRGVGIAITPGDPDQIPAGMKAIYNIGTRLFDPSTVVRIMAHYGVLETEIYAYTDTFIQSLLDTAARISDVAYETSRVTKAARMQLAGNGHFAKYHFDDIIGASPGILHAKNLARKISASDLTVLLEGENGTGKELFASAIHKASGRSKEPFVAINFSALPDTLVESELFGYEEGAFTGAKKGGKIGLFQQADGGTIFLDEIGDASPALQAKLLRVIQEREIMRVGGNKIIPIDVRIIAATNRNLKQMIAEKRFRQDLYYRLKEGYLHLPALADRKEDIPLLLEDWLKTRFDGAKTISPEVTALLLERDWQGNIRELLNTMKYAFAVCDGDTILPKDLPPDEESSPPAAQAEAFSDCICTSTQRCILVAIREISENNGIPGRTGIFKHLKAQGKSVSEYRIRQELQQFQSMDLVQSATGRYGVYLTEKGWDFLVRNHPK